MMENQVNIYQRINKVMQAVNYVKKDTAIQGYKAVSHDQVISVCRSEFVKNGIVVCPQQVGDSQISAVLSKLGEPTSMLRYAAVFNIHFVNMDMPDDRIIVRVEAHANDNGDKAPGKAVTYATKTAILKVLCLETGENDESRADIADEMAEEERLKAFLNSCATFREFLDAWEKGDADCKQKQSMQLVYRAKYKTFSKMDRINGCNTAYELSKHLTGVLTEEEQDAYNEKLDFINGIEKREMM
jgi:hypothetical protein